MKTALYMTIFSTRCPQSGSLQFAMIEAIYFSTRRGCVKRSCIVARLHSSSEATHAQQIACPFAVHVDVQTENFSFPVNVGCDSSNTMLSRENVSMKLCYSC